MTKDEILSEMKIIAEENGVELTENAEKIASLRAKMCIGLNKCVCDKDNPYRGCISNICKKELEDYKICHCKCFKKV